MESLLTLIEEHPLLKKWVNSCKLEQNMHELRDNIKNHITNEIGAEVRVPSDISEYSVDFLVINENIKKLKALRAEENVLIQKISQTEIEIDKARKKRKNIILASAIGSIILIIVLISVI